VNQIAKIDYKTVLLYIIEFTPIFS